MKKRLLLIFSVVCLVLALTLAMVVPVLAANGASIQKTTVAGATTATSTITVTNNNSTKSITITSITDAVYHIGGLPNPELSGELLPGPGTPVVIPAGGNYFVTFTYALRAGDYGNNVVDVAYIAGTNQEVDPPLDAFNLSYPEKTPIPVPELSAGILFGAGILGLGGFVLVNRRKSTAHI